MIDKKTNKQLLKGLKTKNKSKNPSWWIRYKRKKLVAKLIDSLKTEEVERVWAHNDFLSGVEKKPQSIVMYCQFNKQAEEGIAHAVDGRMDVKFPKYKVNIIDVETLLPTIKESIFKEVTQIL